MKKQKSAPLDAQIETKTMRLLKNGLPTAHVSLSYPVFSGARAEQRNKQAAALLSLIEKESEALSERVFFAYQSAEEVNKRFTHRPYRITLAVEKKEEKQRLLLHYSLSVTHKGKSLALYSFSEAFFLPTGRPLCFFTAPDKIKKTLDFFLKKRYNKRVKTRKAKDRVRI